jgi:hypothetical protein
MCCKIIALWLGPVMPFMICTHVYIKFEQHLGTSRINKSSMKTERCIITYYKSVYSCIYVYMII